MSRWSLSIALAQYLPLCTEEGGLLAVLGEVSRYKVPLGPNLPVRGPALLISKGSVGHTPL